MPVLCAMLHHHHRLAFAYLEERRRYFQIHPEHLRRSSLHVLGSHNTSYQVSDSWGHCSLHLLRVKKQTKRIIIQCLLELKKKNMRAQ